MIRNLSRKDIKGFTLIEVVLVLAIGGLIFLLAFLAFQNASVNRRDTQRRTDAARVISEISNAQSDSGGTLSLPDQNAVKLFKELYLKNFSVPGGTTQYGLLHGPTNQIKNTKNTMFVFPNHKCAGAGGVSASNGNSAVVVILEKGRACRDDE